MEVIAGVDAVQALQRLLPFLPWQLLRNIPHAERQGKTVDILGGAAYWDAFLPILACFFLRLLLGCFYFLTGRLPAVLASNNYPNVPCWTLPLAIALGNF